MVYMLCRKIRKSPLTVLFFLTNKYIWNLWVLKWNQWKYTHLVVNMFSLKDTMNFRKNGTLTIAFKKGILLIDWLIWLRWVFTVARRIFSCSTQTLSCRVWDPVLWPGIKPRSPSLGAQSLSHWTTREVPKLSLFATSNRIAFPQLPPPPFGVFLILFAHFIHTPSHISDSLQDWVLVVCLVLDSTCK